jgi:signal transduction histidine kinase
VRRKILGVAVLTAALAITLFGLPLAYAVHQLYFYDERSELERTALRSALHASADLPNVADAVANQPRGVTVAVYGTDRLRIAGVGPEDGGAPVATAISGVPAELTAGADLITAVPIYDGDRVAAVVRASSARTHLTHKVAGAWALMLGLAALAGVCSSAMAAAQARRLARPLVSLEMAAEELGDGNFAVRAEPCGVVEIDRAGAALNRTATRLDDILARERAFTSVASHQLRTPLTDLRLGLEHALNGPDSGLRAAAVEAMAGADRLSRTIDDVLTLARGAPPATPLALGPVLDDLYRRWVGPLRAAGRLLTVSDEDAGSALASAPAVRQILDVLVDNALTHGAGTVSVIARASAGAVAIDVADQGHTSRPLIPDQAPPPDAPRRLGLSIAASLAAAQNGRLVHARTEPTTRLTVLLPGAPAVESA